MTDYYRLGFLIAKKFIKSAKNINVDDQFKEIHKYLYNEALKISNNPSVADRFADIAIRYFESMLLLKRLKPYITGQQVQWANDFLEAEQFIKKLRSQPLSLQEQAYLGGSLGWLISMMRDEDKWKTDINTLPLDQVYKVGSNKILSLISEGQKDNPFIQYVINLSQYLAEEAAMTSAAISALHQNPENFDEYYLTKLRSGTPNAMEFINSLFESVK